VAFKTPICDFLDIIIKEGASKEGASAFSRLGALAG
jgi:hypothetical protein